MEQHEVLIVGGGNAGISLAARLLRDGAPDLRRPGASIVRTAGGRELRWSALVLCPGMGEDWAATPGLKEAYDEGWAGSTFVASSAPHVWAALSPLRDGTVVFNVPPEPAPCGATALKPLLMACDHWRRTGVLAALKVHLVLSGSSVTGQTEPDATLGRTFASYGVEVHRRARVISVDHAVRRVTVDSAAGRTTLEEVAYAHVVPDYRPPAWIAGSGLAGSSAAGLVDIDPETLRNRDHPSVWAIGDAADVATRPSGGALRPQVDVLAHNLAAAGRGEPLRIYDGYTVMPITVSRRKLLLVEVDRAGDASPSVPLLDLTRPRRSTWLFDRYALKAIYFRRLLRGKV